MNPRQSALLVLGLAARTIRAVSGCAPSPLAATIGNVTLSNKQVARGVELSIGSPPQSFAFLPQWPMNNSFVYGTNGHCTPDFSSAECTTFRGGAYNAIASTTRKVPGQVVYPVDSSPWSAVSYAADTVVLNGSNSTTIANFPFGVPLNDLGQQGYHPMNAIGLGFNSTLLNTLKATGQIASRTWSMFWGLNGAAQTAQMDGILVLGGYDKAKIAGQKYNQALANAASVCPSRMVLSVTDMILNFSNGTNASIFPGTASAAIQACITPDYPVLMTLPDSPYFTNIEKLTNTFIEDRSTGLVYFANRYAPNAIVYSGDLTVTFQSGLSVRVTNDQLVVPDRYIDSNGLIQVNATGPDTTLLALQNVNSNDIMQLGRQFLSVAYVMLNQDANEFTLWQANPTADTQLVAVDTKNMDVTNVCSSANSDNNSSTSSSSPSSPSPSTLSSSSNSAGSHSAVSVGIVVGIAVGCVVATATLASAAVLYILRRRRAVTVARTLPQYNPHRETTLRLADAQATAFHSTPSNYGSSIGLGVINHYHPQEMDASSKVELMEWKDAAGLRHKSQYELQG